MRAIILAARRGVRMIPLTEHTPKPLLKVNNRALIDYTLDLLPKDVSEIIVVVNYLGDQVVDYLTKNYPDLKFRFVWQKDLAGTYKAVELAKEYVQGEKFLVLCSDDLYSKKAVANLIKYNLGTIVKEAEHPERFGVVALKNGNEIESFEEKPIHPKSNLVNTGVHLLDSRIFNYPPSPHANGEYYIVDAITKMSQDFVSIAVDTDFWLPIGYPEDLAKAEAALNLL